jgi:hypothetical protein
MPTNRDYLEHTEKAARETVEALRERVLEAQARADRLTRLEPTLPRIAELVDEAREALGIRSQAPTVVLERLLERLEQTTAERDALKKELATRPQATEPPAPHQEERRSRGSDLPPTLRWFAKQLARRHREREQDELEPYGGSLAEVAPRVEQRLRELSPLPYAPSAVRTSALELGLAALELARAARRAQRYG